MYHVETGMHHPMMMEMAGHGMAMPNPGHYEFGAAGVLGGILPNSAPVPNGGGCNCPGKASGSMAGTLMKPEVIVAIALAVGLGMLISK